MDIAMLSSIQLPFSASVVIFHDILAQLGAHNIVTQSKDERPPLDRVTRISSISD